MAIKNLSMTPKSNLFPTFKAWLRRSCQHFSRIPILIWLNILTIIFLSCLSIYAKVKSKGYGIEVLFSDPFDVGIFYLGWFTAASEALWCAAIAICLFTAMLLPKSNLQFIRFLSLSAVIMTLLYLDDRFRLTLILTVIFGTYQGVKVTVYAIYGLLLVFYAWSCRLTIKKTPYVPLLIAFCLFGFSSAIDIAPISSKGIHAMLEDGTKLIGLINLTIYFWYICQREIKRKIFRI
jgi:hypothetical protein